MTDRAIVVRYGELFLKGENRPFFERTLEENLRRAIGDLPGARVDRLHGRMLVRASDPAEAVERVRRVFGVTSVSTALLCRAELDAVASAAVACAREAAAARPTGRAVTSQGERPSFKVESRRSDKRFPLPSPEISRRVGAAIVEALGLPVDVHAPDLTVGVEIGTQATFVWSGDLKGPGGLPVGTGGRVLLLLSGGIDSPVAGWLLQKRGCELAAVYFHSFPYTGDKTREKVTDLARRLAKAQRALPLHVVHFTEAQKQLRAAGPGEIAVVLYRRMMVRVAGAIARRDHIGAIATGENIGQVASQTLENIACIEAAADRPVLRPLLTYDKTETMALARQIGTYELSILPYDDCCSLFVPEHPSTRVRREVAEAAEAKLDVAAMADELARTAELVALSGCLTPSAGT